MKTTLKGFKMEGFKVEIKGHCDDESMFEKGVNLDCNIEFGNYEIEEMEVDLVELIKMYKALLIQP